MSNPFFEPWFTPYGVPPFDAIETSHFRPAYARALEQHDREIGEIAGQGEPPTFDNTIVALENAGKLLRQVEMIFGQLTAAHTNDELQAVEREMSPLVTRHWTNIYLNPKLFARIEDLYNRRDSLALDPESRRVLERYHLDCPAHRCAARTLRGNHGAARNAGHGLQSGRPCR